MFKIALSLSLAALFFSARAHADCSAIDVRKLKPALADYFSKTHKQGHMGWCYANAAADVLSQKYGFPVSANDLAYSYNYDISTDALDNILHRALTRDFSDEELNAGVVSGIMESAQKHGLCPESVLPSISKYYTSDAQGKQLTRDIIFDDILSLEKLRDLVRNNGVSRGDFVKSSDVNAVIESQDFQDLFPGASANKIYSSIELSHDKNINSTLFFYAERACKQDRVAAANLQAEHAGWIMFKGETLIPAALRPDLLSTVDAVLQRGGIVAAGINVKMIVDHSAEHVLAIVGRDMRDGECKYLLRNSWSEACKRYYPELQKDCNNEDGTVWVGKDRLEQYLINIEYVD